MLFRLLLLTSMGGGLAGSGWAQQFPSYAISGQHPHLAGQRVYVLVPERPSPTRT